MLLDVYQSKICVINHIFIILHEVIITTISKLFSKKKFHNLINKFLINNFVSIIDEKKINFSE